jgi:hypothetical protein
MCLIKHNLIIRTISSKIIPIDLDGVFLTKQILLGSVQSFKDIDSRIDKEYTFGNFDFFKSFN